MHRSAENSILQGRKIEWHLETDPLVLATEGGGGVEIFYKGHRKRYVFRSGIVWRVQTGDDEFVHIPKEEVKNCQMVLFDLFPESQEVFCEALRVRFSQST